MSNARHSQAAPDWYTPIAIVEAARDVLGGIDLDPASEPTANHHIRAKSYCTAEMNGLTYQWKGTVFLNPPGGLVVKFWQKLIEEFVAGRTRSATWIGYSLEQLQTLQGKASHSPLDFSLCVPAQRISFVENGARRAARLAAWTPTEKQKKFPEKLSPTHANYISYLGPHRARFVECFSQFGAVIE